MQIERERERERVSERECLDVCESACRRHTDSRGRERET